MIYTDKLKPHGQKLPLVTQEQARLLMEATQNAQRWQAIDANASSAMHSILNWINSNSDGGSYSVWDSPESWTDLSRQIARSSYQLALAMEAERQRLIKHEQQGNRHE